MDRNRCVLIVLVYVLSVLGQSLCNPIVPPEPLAQTRQAGGCISYILEGKGDFKLQKNEYSLQNSNFVIDSMRLVRRTSFYKCEPVSSKYGTDPDRRSWWVDRGCEGIFEIQECPSDGTEAVVPEAWKGTVYSSINKRRLGNPSRTVDLQKWNLSGVENRFESARRSVTRN